MTEKAIVIEMNFNVEDFHNTEKRWCWEFLYQYKTYSSMISEIFF